MSGSTTPTLRPVDLSLLPNSGNDSGFKRVESAPSDATATPADPLAKIVELRPRAGLEVYMVAANGNRAGITDAYAEGFDTATEGLYLRQAAANQLDALVDYLQERDPELGIIVLTGSFDPMEATASWRCNYGFACETLGIDPETKDNDLIQRAGAYASNITGLPELKENDSVLRRYRVALGLDNEASRSDLPGTKTGGMSVHLMLTRSGLPVMNGTSYDNEDDAPNALDWFETHSVTDLVELVQRFPRLKSYFAGFGFEDLSEEGLTPAFEQAQANRRLFLDAVLAVGGLPVAVSSTFVTFGDDVYQDYCRAAMTGQSVATMTSKGTALQLGALLP